MTEMQQKLLDMFSWFHNFCEENSLTYFALGGTTLGAVRHNGFIPWDDDIDIGLPRKDYEKLHSLLSVANSHSKYCIEFPSDKKDFVYSYAKVYDKTTTLVENTRYKTKRGIYLDIFPIDGIGNTKEESLKKFKKIDSYIKILRMINCPITDTRKFYKNIALACLQLTSDITFNSLKIIRKIDRLSKQIDFDTATYVANLSGAWHEKEIMKKEWIGNLKLCDFENTKIYTVENCDAYLSHLYGDYMTPPSPEKQISHHDYLYLNLNESY